MPCLPGELTVWEWCRNEEEEEEEEDEAIAEMHRETPAERRRRLADAFQRRFAADDG